MMSQMSPCFVKMSGTGNSFLIIDVRKQDTAAKITAHFGIGRKELAQALCQGERGTSADGLIFIEDATNDNCSFRWDFYNADGSSAEMCGNAARCVSLFYQKKITPTTGNVKFETLAGMVEAFILSEDSVRVSMPPWTIEKPRQIYRAEMYERQFTLINTGVPHLVAEEQKIDLEVLTKEAGLFRHHDSLGKKGANVTYYRAVSSNVIEAVTFERGVEGFTLSCGTGAVAAALAYKGEALTEKEVEVRVRGGTVFVSLDEQTKQALLSGEARFLTDVYYY